MWMDEHSKAIRVLGAFVERTLPAIIFVLMISACNSGVAVWTPSQASPEDISKGITASPPTHQFMQNPSATITWPTSTPVYPPTAQAPTPSITSQSLAEGYVVPRITSEDLSYLRESFLLTDTLNEGLFLHFNDTGQYSVIDVSETDPNVVEDAPQGWTRTFFRLGFAHFRNFVAYEDNQANLWISDLINGRAIQILSLPGRIQEELLFTWAPDDRHLIIDFDNAQLTDLIFHLETGQWEIWSYVCDRLALSPYSQTMAVWCMSSENSRFTVIEWGGSYWYSDTPPEQSVLISPLTTYARFRLFPIYRSAGWSSDGESIAYYDPQDETGALTIMNYRGEVQRRFPGRAYWLTGYYQEHAYLPGLPIQWSLDGSRLLILGIGENDHPCGDFTSTVDNRTYQNPGCWQIIDPTTGNTLWQDSDIPYNANPGIFIRNQYSEATISSEGTYISLESYFPADIRFYIVDSNTGGILYDRSWNILRMRWGEIPQE